MLVVMIGIRKSLECLFTHRELKILDDIMPEMTRRAAVEDMHNLDEGDVSCVSYYYHEICICNLI